MWRVEQPDFDAGETFTTCISRVRNPENRRRLTAIRPNIETAADDYVAKAENSELCLIPKIDPIGLVPGSEMVKTYEGRMAKKGQPGRPIYDQIMLLPEGDRCPFCDHRNVSTLDHVLPKTLYPIFAVTPINLVGSCIDCNKLKWHAEPTSENDTVLHPYFDDVTEIQWLGAHVVQQTPAALIFHVLEVGEWDETLNARIVHQFDLLELANLYSSQAAREITDIRKNLQRHFNSGGAGAVRAELEFQGESRRANRINSWQTATYEALAESDWFCTVGFDRF
ncbi:MULTISPECIES: hypothetical protein [Pseudomonadota]|uniref:hypothetical protein n=1 Tax=Pseudomonadota TaxID=1224 RepID=UPI003A8FB694